MGLNFNAITVCVYCKIFYHLSYQKMYLYRYYLKDISQRILFGFSEAKYDKNTYAIWAINVWNINPCVIHVHSSLSNINRDVL